MRLSPRPVVYHPPHLPLTVANMITEQSAVARLKQRATRISASDVASDVSKQQSNSVLEQNVEPLAEAAASTPFVEDGGDRDWRRALSASPDSPERITSPMSSMKLVAQVRQIEKQSKENVLARNNRASFIDPQPSAQRIEWDDVSQDPKGTEPPESFQIPERRRVSPKAQVNEVVSSDDEAFEHDDRHHIAKKQRERSSKSKGISVRQQRAKPVKIIEPENEQELSEGRLARASQYKSINHAAKESLVRNGPKPPQVRRPWTEEEVEALMEYMDEYGCSWAAIKNADDEQNQFLERRSQGDLKDKARNMKYDYLRYAACKLIATNISIDPFFKSRRRYAHMFRTRLYW